jgi:hypothetical protein
MIRKINTVTYKRILIITHIINIWFISIILPTSLLKSLLCYRSRKLRFGSMVSNSIFSLYIFMTNPSIITIIILTCHIQSISIPSIWEKINQSSSIVISEIITRVIHVILTIKQIFIYFQKFK